MKKLLFFAILSISLYSCSQPQLTVDQLIDESGWQADTARIFFNQAKLAQARGDSLEQWRLADSADARLTRSMNLLKQAQKLNHMPK